MYTDPELHTATRVSHTPTLLIEQRDNSTDRRKTDASNESSPPGCQTRNNKEPSKPDTGERMINSGCTGLRAFLAQVRRTQIWFKVGLNHFNHDSERDLDRDVAVIIHSPSQETHTNYVSLRQNALALKLSPCYNVRLIAGYQSLCLLVQAIT